MSWLQHDALKSYGALTGWMCGLLRTYRQTLFQNARAMSACSYILTWFVLCDLRWCEAMSCMSLFSFVSMIACLILRDLLWTWVSAHCTQFALKPRCFSERWRTSRPAMSYTHNVRVFARHTNMHFTSNKQTISCTLAWASVRTLEALLGRSPSFL